MSGRAKSIKPIEELAVDEANMEGSRQRYRISTKGKAASKRFRESEKGQAYPAEHPYEEVVHESEISYEFKVTVKGILFNITTSGLTYREARNKARREGIDRYHLGNGGSKQELWNSCRASTIHHGRTVSLRVPRERRIKSPEELAIIEARAEEARQRYTHGEHGIAARRRYQTSDKGKATRARYWASPKGKARHNELTIRRRMTELMIFAESPEGKAYFEEQDKKVQQDRALIEALDERKAILCRLTK